MHLGDSFCIVGVVSTPLRKHLWTYYWQKDERKCARHCDWCWRMSLTCAWSPRWEAALATVLTIKFVTREGFAITNFRLGSWRPYVKVALVVPATFALIYGITWLLGLGHPVARQQTSACLFRDALESLFPKIRIESKYLPYPQLPHHLETDTIHQA